MQNSLDGPMLAGGPVMSSSPSMAVADPYSSDPQAVAFEDVNANPRSRARRRGRGQQDGQVVAAYPLPNFDSPELVGMPAGSVPGQTSQVFLPPIVTNEPTAMPPMPDMTSSPIPVMASGPPLIPQADPAHSVDGGSEMTASIPFVDPH